MGDRMENKNEKAVSEERLEIFSDNLEIKHNIKNPKKYLRAIILLLILNIVSISLVLYIIFFNKTIVETTKLEKDVTITETGIADAVEKVYDSVVVVETYNNDTLYSTGTGFVFKIDNQNGYILTNNHVISNGTTIKVVFTNDEEVEATIVGKDEYSDIAVLSVDKNKIISVAEIGSSEKARLGDTTFSVGAPLDSNKYSWTVTRGILSGKNRLVEVSSTTGNTSTIMEVLQTDTAINSGNSGGPLCNSNGEVIGITNMKISSSTIEGMGFAIPIETAIQYATKIINGESIIRPYLGITMYDLSNNMFYRNQEGVYIQTIVDGGGAKKAGLQVGDIIIKIDDIEVTNSAYLRYELYKHNVGDKVKVTYKRNNKVNTVEVTLSSLNEEL